MPLIDRDDREAHRKQLEENSKKARKGVVALENILPMIAAQIVAAVKESFRRSGTVQYCYKTFRVDESILFVPLDERDQMISDALTKAFELPASAFRMGIGSTHEATCYLDISVTFTPPLK